ncbi:hypothetical protein [Endozoicomonas lisbonensis]|uniref:Uncharacterized protein n=2 Tax=Endozoicomonas lisbonensis TaxID=3120522 RepID=A0ABV2SF83_9GAMM
MMTCKPGFLKSLMSCKSAFIDSRCRGFEFLLESQNLIVLDRIEGRSLNDAIQICSWVEENSGLFYLAFYMEDNLNGHAIGF